MFHALRVISNQLEVPEQSCNTGVRYDTGTTKYKKRSTTNGNRSNTLLLGHAAAEAMSAMVVSMRRVVALGERGGGLLWLVLGNSDSRLSQLGTR